MIKVGKQGFSLLNLTSVLTLMSGFYIGCADSNDDFIVSAETNKSQDSKADSEAQVQALTDFSLLTPLGRSILDDARSWEVAQLNERNEYAQPRMCAHNVSRVLEMSGLYAYSSYLVPDILDSIEARGGRVIQLDSRHETALVDSLNRNFGGRIPVGALLNGCLYEDCGGEGGDGHIAIVGHTDETGVVWAYHNNWYRPDNEGGVRKEYMVSKEYYDDYGLRRQWMATPWIKINRDPETGLVTEAKGVLPAIDDLDPYTGFFLTISIMPELLKEMGALDEEAYFCPEGLRADLLLGACVDGDQPSSNVYSTPSSQMKRECSDRGYGRACSAEFELVLEGGEKVGYSRWSRAVYEGLRGEATCPQGLELNHKLKRCVERIELTQEREEGSETFQETWVHGPFLRKQVERCLPIAGELCFQNRWPSELFKEVRLSTH